MQTKTLGLTVLIVGLALANAYLFFSDPPRQKLRYRTDMFSIADTAQVSEIRIESTRFTHVFSRKSNWRINDQYATDPSMRRILFAVLSRVRVVRPVSAKTIAELKNRIDEGFRVSIQTNDGTLDLISIGNPTLTRTYFLLPDLSEGYEVSIPGYRDYVGSIFQLTTHQWRDRLVFDGNWRSIQQLTFAYGSPSDKDFTIRFSNSFYQVDELAVIDSAAVVEYLNEFEYFQANEWFGEGQMPVFDSLMSLEPEWTITLDDIKYPEPIVLRFYPADPQTRLRPVKNQANDPMVFDDRRLKSLQKARQDFSYKEK
ncbi:MAG: hypothetical protein OEY56_02240 [Cyclobacteriaceae bacterium]|nr:hypothetical protein [Cyclobacteriaceae bacterium]